MKYAMVLLLLLAGAPARAQEILVDDFERDAPAGWQISGSPEYYRGGQGSKGLNIVADGGSRALRAEVRFTDPEASEPLFITKILLEGPTALSVARVRFRFKLTTDQLDPERPFVVRLRTSPTTFNDYPVAPAGGLVPGRWHTVDLDIARPKRLVNIYNTLFGEGAIARIREITFRLDDRDAVNTEGALFVDDIRLVLKAEESTQYTPTITPRKGGSLRRALVIRQSAAGYYGIEEALRELPQVPAVDVRLFRGLHFPIFGFPASREALFAYDLVALADVDPYVLTVDQVRWLCDYVASGGGLLFVDGPNTFGDAKRFPAPLAALLPVTFQPGEGMVALNAEVQAGASMGSQASPDFPYILRALPASWGRIARAHPLRARPEATVLLRAGSETPRGWGVYTGGTWEDISLESEPGGHSGARCAALVLRRYYVDPKSGKPTGITGALLAAATNGYEGAGAIEARPNTRYHFSFWVRGDVPTAAVGVRGWTTEAAKSGDRETIAATLQTVRPEAEWRRYAGEFTTTAETRRFALQFGVSGSPAVLSPGQRLRVDDVEVAEAREGAPNLVVNAGAEESTAMPVLAAGAYQRGRVLVLAGYPAVADSTEGSFFTGDAYDDLLGQAAHWLSGSSPAAWFEEFTPAPATAAPGQALRMAARAGGQAAKAMRCRIRAPGAGKPLFDHISPIGADGAVSFPTTAPAAPGTYAAALELLDAAGRVLARRTRAFRIESAFALSVRFPYGKSAFAPGMPLAFTVSIGQLAGGSGTTGGPARGAVPPGPGGTVAGAAGGAAGTGGAAAAGAKGPAPGTGGAVGAVGGAAGQAAGGSALEGLSARVRLLDFRGTVVHAFPARPAAEALSYRIAVPEWEAGDYQVSVELLPHKSLPVSRLSIPFTVVDRLDFGRLFPVASILGTDGGGQVLDEGRIRARVDDLIAHGFNTVALTGARSYLREPPRHHDTVRNATEAYAQSRGMAVMFEYEGFQRLGREKPTQPCVFSPEYPAALAERVRDLAAVGRTVPRLLSIKVTDEPFAGPESMDYCEHCRRVFRERYGFDLRPPEKIPADAVTERIAYQRFVSDYVSEGFRQGYAYKQKAGDPYRLLLTYCAPGYGYGATGKSLEDAAAWSRHADLIDFDVYPYFYPASEKIRMVQVHYCFAAHRAIARALGRPMGFYVELDDRNYPFQVNPVEASSECAYTALAQGADYLNTFINTAFGTGTGARPERWAHLGRELRKVAPLLPLFKATRRPAAPVALYFPRAQWMLGKKAYAPAYAYQAALRAFGEVDVLDEDTVRAQGLGPVRALLLLDTEVLPDDAAAKIAAFVRAGGLLICDRVPTANDRGEAVRWPAGLFPEGGVLSGGQAAGTTPAVAITVAGAAAGAGTAAGAQAPAGAAAGAGKAAIPPDPGGAAAGAGKAAGEAAPSDALGAQRHTYGKGQVMLLSASLEAAFRAATETPDAPAGTRILSRLRAALDGAGLRSRVRPEDPEVECGLRLGRNAAVLVAVNHRAEAVTTRVRLGDLGFVPANAVDATSGKPLALERVPAAGAKGAPAAKGGAAAPALAVRLSLPARNGAVVVLYPQRLASVRVKAEAPTVARGETLRYRVQVLGADGRPARGTHALDATVADARGQVRARYGGPVATQDGAFTFAVPVAVNAALGAWRIHVREATTGAQANAAFGVR